MLALIIVAVGFSIAALRLSWALAGLADGVRKILYLWLEKAYRETPDLDPEITTPIPEYILAWIDRESEEWAKEDLRSELIGLYREHEDWDVVFRIIASGHAGWGAEFKAETDAGVETT